MKPRKDIITEEEYTRKMAPTSLSPQDDSPGDSETDAGAEFEMGVNYMPTDSDEDDTEDIEELLAADEVELATKAEKMPIRRIEEDELPDSAKVISSNQPSPWMDRESTSDTN